VLVRVVCLSRVRTELNPEMLSLALSQNSDTDTSGKYVMRSVIYNRRPIHNTRRQPENEQELCLVLESSGCGV
jgi:hypothetical protein